MTATPTTTPITSGSRAAGSDGVSRRSRIEHLESTGRLDPVVTSRRDSLPSGTPPASAARRGTSTAPARAHSRRRCEGRRRTRRGAFRSPASSAIMRAGAVGTGRKPALVFPHADDVRVPARDRPTGRRSEHSAGDAEHGADENGERPGDVRVDQRLRLLRSRYRRSGLKRRCSAWR